MGGRMKTGYRWQGVVGLLVTTVVAAEKAAVVVLLVLEAEDFAVAATMSVISSLCRMPWQFVIRRLNPNDIQTII